MAIYIDQPIARELPLLNHLMGNEIGASGTKSLHVVTSMRSNLIFCSRMSTVRLPIYRWSFFSHMILLFTTISCSLYLHVRPETILWYTLLTSWLFKHRAGLRQRSTATT